MARLSQTTNLQGVEVTRSIGPNGRPVIDSFIIKLHEQLVEAGLVQLRVIAEEARELIIDKLYAGSVQRPGTASVDRPKRLRRSEIPTTDRRPIRHPALAESTVKKKAGLKQDGRRLIATGAYTYGIEVFKSAKAGKIHYTVRPKPGKHPTSKLTHRVIAAMHEFGTRRAPKRPHWTPALKITKRILRERGPGVRAVALRKAIREVR